MAGKKNCMQLCALLLLLFKKRNTRTRLLAVVPESTANRHIKSEKQDYRISGPSFTAQHNSPQDSGNNQRPSATRGGKPLQQLLQSLNKDCNLTPEEKQLDIARHQVYFVEAGFLMHFCPTIKQTYCQQGKSDHYTAETNFKARWSNSVPGLATCRPMECSGQFTLSLHGP